MKLVECLNCGESRHVAKDASRAMQRDECDRCSYVGWAETKTLTETLRRALRETTLEQRRVLRSPLAAW
jgi:hypothetical protein